MSLLAPITLFTYNRPDHTRRTVEALAKNELAAESDLIIFSDGPKDDAGFAKVKAVRDYLHTITGFKNITINEKERNCGLANSIIAGVTEIVNKYGAVIVLEDDMVTAPYFLRYMNDALEIYKDEEQVISIHGYMYPVKEQLPETFSCLALTAGDGPPGSAAGICLSRTGENCLRNCSVKSSHRHLILKAHSRLLKCLKTRLAEKWTHGPSDGAHPHFCTIN